jgi:hypothetical protein
MKLEITEVQVHQGQLQVAVSVFFRKADKLEFARSEEFARIMDKQYHDKYNAAYNQKINKVGSCDTYYLGLPLTNDANGMAEIVAQALKDIWSEVQQYSPIPMPDEELRGRMNEILAKE